MTTIPPLPKNDNTGKCPWCKARLCECSYDTSAEGEIDVTVEKLQTTAACPECDRPIRIAIQRERVIYSYQVVIAPARTATDRRYLQLVGISEDA